MPVKRVAGGWKTKSAITGKWLKTTFRTKAEAESRCATSKRRSLRKRSRESVRARRKYTRRKK